MEGDKGGGGGGGGGGEEVKVEREEREEWGSEGVKVVGVKMMSFEETV